MRELLIQKIELSHIPDRQIQCTGWLGLHASSALILMTDEKVCQHTPSN